MKTLRKWDHKAHEYKPFPVPDDGVFVVCSDDLNQVVNCCQCLKKLLRGSAYTSLEVHNQFGLGYPVCEECYQKEWERERATRMEEEAIRNGK